MPNYTVKESVLICRRLTRMSNSSFVPAFSLLPRAKREAMEILYAFNRFTDDLIDLPDVDPKTGRPIPTSPRRKRQKLNQWVGALEAVFGGMPGTPNEQPLIADSTDAAGFQALEKKFAGCSGLVLLPALKMIVERFNMPIDPFFHLIEGIDSDIEPRRFEMFEDCADYCHQVATSVGFSSLAIWGTTEPLFSDHVLKAAKACGIAFQWTNILRDLVEDFGEGRIYLPMDEIQRAGLTEAQFGSLLDRKSWDEMKKKPKDKSQFDPYAHADLLRQLESFEIKFDALLQKQFERCEIYYANAAPLYKLINRDSRRVYGMMWNRYYKLFHKIRRNPKRLLRGRVCLSDGQKIRLFLRWRLLPCLRLK